MKAPQDTATRQIDYRHPLPVRVWHWVNAAAVVVLLMTGLLIFDIHPHLYWGEVGQEGEGAFPGKEDRGDVLTEAGEVVA